MKFLLIRLLMFGLLNFYPGYLQRVENVSLECLSSQIIITINDSFFVGKNESVSNAAQLYIDGYPQCHSNQIDGGYELIQFTPYGSCGTSESHNGDFYVYQNQIVVYSPERNSTTPILLFTCEYEDQYVVSSNLSITPNVRTLNFITSRGTFSVEMNLFQRKDFHPKSKYGSRPRIIVGAPVYVSVDLRDVFGMEEIAVTLQSCYATTMSNYEEISQGNIHYFIVGRCVSPDDNTVRILSNGISNQARFSFLMFQWKNREEYIYLHCEVQICNKTAERCFGTGPLCNGSVESLSSKRKRDVLDVTEKTGFISVGPINLVKLDNGSALLQTFDNNSIPVPLEKVKRNSQKLLLAYVLGSIAAILVIVCGFLFILVVMKKKQLKMKLLNE